jgi:hypothetical protein
MRQTVTYVLFSLMVVQPLLADIGEITELRGNGAVIRDDTVPAFLEQDIQQMDDVRTANGRLGITFVDDSQVRLTEHSKLVIDEVIFDPNPSKSKMTMQFASGTARFITGKIGQIDKQNINISTPTAQIGIRGTDFTVTVDEFGRSLVILLPDNDGLPSGEIVVATAMGQVTLNKPYQSTVATVWEQNPTKPVILDLTLDLIDNLLIVSPPKENERLREVEGEGRDGDSSTNILDIDYLADESLNVDYLSNEEFSFNELDIDYLGTNFLEDLLEVMEAVDELDDRELQAVGIAPVDIKGTVFGQDSSTQITTFGDAEFLTLIRQVNQYTRLDINGQTGYNIILEQDGKSYNVIIGSGSDVTIRIRQSSG